MINFRKSWHYFVFFHGCVRKGVSIRGPGYLQSIWKNKSRLSLEDVKRVRESNT